MATASELHHSVDDWQAQLEEVLALQSIFADNFRVTHIPGHELVGSSSSRSCSGDSSSAAAHCDDASSSRNRSSGSGGSSDSGARPGHQQLEEQLQSLLGCSPPSSAAAGLITCEATVHVELPAGQLQLVLDLQDKLQSDCGLQDTPPHSSCDVAAAAAAVAASSSGSSSGSSSSTTRMPFGPPVSYLPPICVQLVLPANYPSNEGSPPLVQLQASWLAAHQLTQLQQQLQQLWEEQGPGPVCYSWLDHLKLHALPALGIANELVLQQPPEAAAAAKQAAKQAAKPAGAAGGPVGGCSLEQLIAALLHYSAACEAEAFMAASWRCGICFEQVPGSSCLRLPDCQHFYCTTCLKAHAASQMQQGAVDNMRCPEPSCRRGLPPYVIKQLLGEGFDRWDDLLLQRTLDKMDDVVYCPRCTAVCIEDKDHCAQCEQCLYVFCSCCSGSWHPGSECMDPNKHLRVLEQHKEATTGSSRTGDVHHHESDLLNQCMNLAYLAAESRKCPSCGVATVKDGGCRLMFCTHCRTAWCWECQQVSKDCRDCCHCTFYVKYEERAPWETGRMWAREMGQVVTQAQVHGTVPMCRCPLCGQGNLQLGRLNLMRCWCCDCRFCFSCRTLLRPRTGGRHFGGEGACKLHSD